MAGNINTAEYPTSHPDVKFRGHWSPSIRSPTYQPFLPIAPPQKPKVKNQSPAAPPVVGKKALTQPPSGAYEDGALNIWDRYNNWRGYIAPDGTCYNNCNDVIGYINEAAGEAGSVDCEFLGLIRSDYVIENNLAQKCGTLDPGRAYIKNWNDVTVAEMLKTGECNGHNGTHLGQFHGFDFHRMKLIALYLLLIDPGMLNEVEG
eukprot:TRINITY_DN2352_c0_g1_i1.p1 TRINITY_DN2352_c0_g1~~TRINITY_DN2352_c0_g1_i1.p1  ORF type:complete len:222 (-),score=42.96 TRINITY_DN2352_c0_g1_i1:119-730(-)